MVNFIIDNYTWFLILILLFNMSQRKLPRSDKKRFATIYIAFLSLLFYIGCIVIGTKGWSEWFILPLFIVTIALGFIFRKRVWPFRIHCLKCGKKMDWSHIFGHDENICEECWLKDHPEEAKKKEESKLTKEDKRMLSWQTATKVDDIEWEYWEPTDRCVITYVEDGDKLLFIEKKRGMGQGYFNAPGGHIELEETAIEAAIRETKEETGLDVADLEYRGVLHFNFKDIREIGYVYFTKTFSGELKECDEARPFWINRNEIPYDNMWEDDKLWLPDALKGKKFKAYFIFDDKTMIDSKVIWDEE